MKGTLTAAGFTIPTGQDRILDNYNNDETPTFHWFVGSCCLWQVRTEAAEISLFPADLCSFYINFCLFLIYVSLFCISPL